MVALEPGRPRRTKANQRAVDSIPRYKYNSRSVERKSSSVLNRFKITVLYSETDRMTGPAKIWNFGKNVCIDPEFICRPKSKTDVLETLAKHHQQKIRVIGSLHAWSDAVKTSGVVIELAAINSISVDTESATVTVGGGCKIKRLLKELASHKLTLPSVGLIDEQTVAGATATATHGSGKNSLSHYIVAIEIAHFDEATGEPKITCIDSGPELEAARCSLGLMGVVLSITFQCCPSYNVEEYTAVHPTLESVLAIEAQCPQQQFYLMPWSWTYFGHHRVSTAKPRSKLASLYRLYCFLVIDIGLHIAVCTMAKLLKPAWATRFFFKRILPLTIVRNWKVVDDSHAMLTMEHELFRHIEIELFVQRSKLQEATEFLTRVLEHSAGSDQTTCIANDHRWDQLACQSDLQTLHGCYVHRYPICYRRIKNDDVLISMAAASEESQEDWYAISLISYQNPNDRDGFFLFADFIANAFAGLFRGRCHWGKHNPLDKPANEKLYPKLDEFRGIVKRFDGESKFQNDWLDRVI